MNNMLKEAVFWIAFFMGIALVYGGWTVVVVGGGLCRIGRRVRQWIAKKAAKTV